MPDSPNFPALKNLLKQYWGFENFRPLQEDVMNAVLSGRDVLALMPTGGGKSLCYQVPALGTNGLCLVVSPLIALMKDQVSALRKKGITAFAIYAGMKRNEVIQTLRLASNSNCKLLYVSPERLETALFKEWMPSLSISLIAVDEAHCISQWGYDFRPPYLRISALREDLGEVPILALTASATRDVEKDIADKLHLKQPAIFRQSFARPNLSYSVFNTSAKMNKLLAVLKNVQGSSIVYCRTRKACKELATQLQSFGIKADFYHAGLSTEERSEKQDAWIKNQLSSIVCTTAFGMGIDKPDVRTVIHYDLPDCLESYYQEAGRAGRDGKKSYAVLLYEEADIDSLKRQIQQRFPDLDTIRLIYQEIANYLQLPEGSGEGLYFDFDSADFGKKFRHPVYEVMSVLKVLEQEDLLGFNEQVFTPSKLQFVCSKETLYQFEQDRPTLEPLIKALLRSYSGVFDMPVLIYERQLAALLKVDAEVIRKSLAELHSYLIVHYEPQKDNPQLFFPQARLRASDLVINHAQYGKRKNEAEKRAGVMIDYAEKINNCRSAYIGAYFGDNDLQPCGVCDNCLQKKKQQLRPAAFNSIIENIESALQQGPVELNNLITRLQGVNKEDAWEVITFLQSERKIQIDNNGLIALETISRKGGK